MMDKSYSKPILYCIHKHNGDNTKLLLFRFRFSIFKFLLTININIFHKYELIITFYSIIKQIPN